MIKFLRTSWYDIEINKEIFGIKAKDGDRNWLNLAENGKPLFYKNEQERNDRIIELRKMYKD